MEKWIAHLRNEKEDITMTSVEYDTRKEAEKFTKKITEKYSGFTKWKIYSSKDGVDNRPVTERIKTYEDACDELGIDPFLNKWTAEAKVTSDEVAYYSLKVIAKALNEGWEPDWTNKDERKYYPWFYIEDTNPAGLSASNAKYSVATAHTYFGSHLCFKTSALAKYAGTQFVNLYEKYLL